MGSQRQLDGDAEHGAHTLKVWNGLVVGVYGRDVFVELTPRMQGVLNVSQFESPPLVGESFDFTLRGREEGLWALDLERVGALDTWETMEPGSLVPARIVRPTHGGLEAKVGPLHAFLPKSQTGLQRDESVDVLVGRTMTCEVLEVRADRQTVLLSRKAVLQRERTSSRASQVGRLRPGQVVKGRVTRLERYGAFVAFGAGLEGLVHVSDLAYERVPHPSDMLEVGQDVDAKILSVRRSGKRIGLGLKQMQPSPWSELDAKKLHESLTRGVVTRVMPFGAFVRIRKGVIGLLPNSEMGLEAGRGPKSLLSDGSEVVVRVLSVEPENERLSLSALSRDGRHLVEDDLSVDWTKLPKDLPAGSLGEKMARAFGREPAQDGGECTESA